MVQPHALQELRIEQLPGKLVFILLLLLIVLLTDVAIVIVPRGLGPIAVLALFVLSFEVVSLIPQTLPPFNVFENVVARIGQNRCVIGVRKFSRIQATWIDLGGHHISLVELDEPRQPWLLFCVRVWPFQELVDVVEDEKVLEHRHQVRRFVVHQIVDRLHLAVLLVLLIILVVPVKLEEGERLLFGKQATCPLTPSVSLPNW